MNNKLIFPQDIMIEITNRCNLNCTTCYVHIDGRPKQDMSFELFKKIINEIPAKENKTLSLYNYWEPLLHMEIGRFVQYAKTSGIKNIKIATNGHMLTTKIWAELILGWLDYICISIDGTTQEIYEKFRRWWNLHLVINNILQFVRLRDKIGKNPVIEILFIVTSENMHQIAHIKNLAKVLGADLLKLKKVEITGAQWKYLDPGKIFSRYENQATIHSCKKPQEWIVINVDWTVLPCCYITDHRIKTHNFWNIKNNTLSEIFFFQKNQTFISTLDQDKKEVDYCKNCNEGNINLYYDVIEFK